MFLRLLPEMIRLMHMYGRKRYRYRMLVGRPPPTAPAAACTSADLPPPPGHGDRYAFTHFFCTLAWLQNEHSEAFLYVMENVSGLVAVFIEYIHGAPRRTAPRRLALPCHSLAARSSPHRAHPCATVCASPAPRSDHRARSAAVYHDPHRLGAREQGAAHVPITGGGRRFRRGVLCDQRQGGRWYLPHARLRHQGGGAGGRAGVVAVETGFHCGDEVCLARGTPCALHPLPYCALLAPSPCPRRPTRGSSSVRWAPSCS